MDKNDPEYARQSMFVEREEQRMNEMQRMRFGGPRDMVRHSLIPFSIDLAISQSTHTLYCLSLCVLW